MQITVVVPTFNEAENLPRLVSALFALPLDLRVLVADDHSPDGTGQIADQLAKQNPHRLSVLHRDGKLGLRAAYLDSFKHLLNTDTDAIVQMDADLSHDPSVLPLMAERLASCDLVLGSRYVKGGSVDSSWPLWRKSLSAFGNHYARTILRFPLRDVTTGFRMWRRGTLAGLPLDRVTANGYVFQVEMAYLAHCLEYRIEEVPIYFPDRKLGRSKMSLQISAEAALRVWQVLWECRDLKKQGRQARIK